MYSGKSVSLIFPTYNEEENISQAIGEFKNLHVFDEIIVVDNNSTDDTAKKASRKKVRVISEKKQGYGYALQRGMKEASGDYIILCEPDGTFSARDSIILLKHIDKFDIVSGTRTNKAYIHQRANMHGLLRWGNKSLAKIIEIFYDANCHISDCGCTYRIMKKSVVKDVLPHLTVGGTYFLSQLLIVSILKKYKMKEIPIHYQPRIGESKITGSLVRSITVGLKMIGIMIKYKFTKP